MNGCLAIAVFLVLHVTPKALTVNSGVPGSVESGGIRKIPSEIAFLLPVKKLIAVRRAIHLELQGTYVRTLLEYGTIKAARNISLCKSTQRLIMVFCTPTHVATVLHAHGRVAA